MIYGTARNYLDLLLKESGCRVTVMHNWRDVWRRAGTFDGTSVGTHRFDEKQKSDLGLGTDGDADRFGIVDSDGSFIQPNEILPPFLTIWCARASGKAWWRAR